MKVLCSRWMVRGLVVAVAGLFVSMMMFFADGGINFVGLGICLVVVLGGLLWASCDVVVITSRKIFRGFKSLELEKIQDLVLLPGERFIAPNIKSCKGYEIVALTAKGEWRIGLFGEDLGRLGGIHPRVRARLAALREKILR
jgi:hypothetical protein